MNNPVTELLKVHFRSFFREPGIIFWALLFPIIMAWVLGLAFSEKPEQKMVVYLVGETKTLDTLKNKTFKIPEVEANIKINFKKASEEQALKAIRKGEINLYVEEKEGRLIYNYDPANAEAFNTHLMTERLLNRNVGKNEEVRAITTQGNRYIDFLIPGLIALGIMNSCMWGISYTLIEFRMKKLLRRMVATPMKRSHFMFSHFLFRVIISSVEAALLVLFALFFFDLYIQGSIAAFLLLILSGIFCFTGLAILVASRTRNSQIGNGLINAIILPMMILSGIFFSYHNFPEWAVNFIRFLPLTILTDSIRAVFNEGTGLEAQSIPVLVLATVGLVCYSIGIKLFKWY